jgi:hypothetical protein
VTPLSEVTLSDEDGINQTGHSTLPWCKKQRGLCRSITRIARFKIIGIFHFDYATRLISRGLKLEQESEKV